ncbi:MAG: M20/M25/M40 family metallo-hydrolase [Caulobacter sp.]|nr:M20/M25/M40 family metallo-hydrolase [Caulobacter sp.]
MSKDWMRYGWLALALLGAALLAWQGTITPKPAPATVPASAFSAERALRDIAVIAREPHPVASPANAKVRDYLLGRMTQLGLSPTVQETDALSFSPDYPQWLAGAHVQNLIGILPGKDRTAPAIVLMSHYDSAPGSPGAADDATGVAASLEVIRALKARGAPARDVIVLITDGEEWGLSGAEAYFGQHPLAKRTGLIINMEARGGGGRANMFETGRDNGDLIARYRTSAKGPISSALAVFLYEKMPNDTDFSVPKRMGMTGLNFAFIGRQFDYHSPTSTIANLDPGSVQSMGEQVLAATAEFASAKPLPGKAPSAVYSQTFGDHILAYPPIVGWLVLALAGGLLILAGRRARAAGERLRWQDGLRGAAIALATTLLAALLLHVARRWTGVEFGFLEQRPLLAAWPAWETAIFVIGTATALIGAQLAGKAVRRRWLTSLVCVAIGGLSSLAGGFDPVGLGLGVVAGLLFLTRRAALPRNAAWAGVLCLGLVLATTLQVFAAQTAFLVAWPLTLAALGAAVSRWGADTRVTALLAALAAIVCGWLGAYVHLTAQGLDFPALLGLFALLALMVLWPLAQPDEERAKADGLVLASLWAAVVLAGLAVITATVAPWTPRYPQADSVMHVTDSHAGHAWMVIQDGGEPGVSILKQTAPSPQSKAAVRASLPPLFDQPVSLTSTPGAPVALPTFASRIEPDGRVTMVLTPPPGARLARLNIKLGAAVAEVVVQGQRTTWLGKPGEVHRLRWAGSGQPLTISFRPVKPDAGLAEVDFGTVREAWPPAAARPRRSADHSMAWNLSGSTGVAGKAIVRW